MNIPAQTLITELLIEAHAETPGVTLDTWMGDMTVYPYTLQTIAIALQHSTEYIYIYK